MTLDRRETEWVLLLWRWVKFNEKEYAKDTGPDGILTWVRGAKRIARFLSQGDRDCYEIIERYEQAERISRAEEEEDDEVDLSKYPRADVIPCTLCGYADHSAQQHVSYFKAKVSVAPASGEPFIEPNPAAVTFGQDEGLLVYQYAIATTSDTEHLADPKSKREIVRGKGEINRSGQAGRRFGRQHEYASLCGVRPVFIVSQSATAKVCKKCMTKADKMGLVE